MPPVAVCRACHMTGAERCVAESLNTCHDCVQERVQSAARATTDQSNLQRLKVLKAAFTRIEAVTGVFHLSLASPRDMLH